MAAHVADERRPADGLLRYDQLGLAFVVEADGLALQGPMHRWSAGNRDDRRRRCATGSRAAGRAPLRRKLVRTLVPGNEVAVPATRETDLLNRVLPLPQIVHPLDLFGPQDRIKLE